MRNFLLQRYLADRDGATAVEFALISALFFTFIFGIIETGRIFWTMNTLQYAVEQTARYALVNSDATAEELTDVAADSMTGVQVDTTDLNVVVTNTTVSGIDFIEVDGTYAYQLWVPLLPAEMQNMTLTASTRQPVP